MFAEKISFGYGKRLGGTNVTVDMVIFCLLSFSKRNGGRNKNDIFLELNVKIWALAGLVCVALLKPRESEEQQRDYHCISRPNKAEPLRKRYKISVEQQVAIHHKLCENPEMTSKELLRLFPDVKISENQLSRIRKEWGLERKRGRPKGKKQAQAPQAEEKSRPKIWHCLHLPKIGLRLFALWMEQTQRHAPVLETIYELIAEYKKEHPEEKFRLLRHSKETIAQKWKALSILGLAGIKKLSELDYHQHDLDRILVDGCSYSYSSLRQFLADFATINARSKKLKVKS